jgi:hypothetical protein
MHRKIFLYVLFSILLLSILSELPFSLKAGKQAQDSQLANGSVTTINETEYTWYGDFIVNENETVVIENCNFTVMDGSIIDYGELQVLNSTIQVRKSSYLKYIKVYGSFNVSSSSIVGTGWIQLLGKDVYPTEQCLSLYNATLASWDILPWEDPIHAIVYIRDSAVGRLEIGGSMIDVSIQSSDVSYVLFSPWFDSLHSLEIVDSHVGSIEFGSCLPEVYINGLHKDAIEDWSFSILSNNFSITNSIIDSWLLSLGNDQSLYLSDSDVTVSLTYHRPMSENLVNLTLRPGFFEDEIICSYDAVPLSSINMTLHNSTVESWECVVFAGQLRILDSNCTAYVLGGSSPTIVNSSIFLLSTYSFRGNLTVTDSTVEVFDLWRARGSSNLTLTEGYQDFLNVFNEQQPVNITLSRTIVNHWSLTGFGGAALNVYNSTLRGSIGLLNLDVSLRLTGPSKVCVYNSVLGNVMAQSNSSLVLVDSTMQTLYAYDYANVTAIDSTIDTIIKDPPTITLINSQLRSDISLSFQMPEDILSACLRDDPETPLPLGIARFGKYLQVDTIYDDVVDAQVSIYYNETEVGEAGVDERGLRLYYLDESGVWQPCQRHGVDIEENFAWANVTRFSCFAVGFGSHHDLAVIDGSLMKTVVGQGFGNALNLTVMNQGVFPENSSLTVYANATVIGTVETVAVEALDSLIMTFNWSTTDLARGNYAITACVWPVTNESDTEDNALTVGTVYVGIPGDVNADGIVELMDFYYASNAYLSTSEKLNWNPNADINNDGVVELMDFFIMSQHYLEHTP